MSFARDVRFASALLLGSVLAAGFAVGVRAAIDGTFALALGSGNVLEAFRGLPLWARAVAPPTGALMGGVVAWWASRRLPESHGVADVMEALVLGRGRVSLRTALAKSLASFLAIVGGGSLGREGPLIQVGAALAGNLGAMLGVDPMRRRILFAAGAAAGFAAAYNTPIAATLFVLEVMAGVITVELAVPVFCAAAIATFVARYALGDAPLYGARDAALFTSGQRLAAIFLGPLGGLVGVAFMRLLAQSEQLFVRLVPRSRPLRAALGGAVVGGLAMALPEITGNGAEAIREMLDGRVLGLTFFALLLAKPLATAASVGSGSSGGVFTPSMFIGAALGAGLASLFLGGGASEHPVIGAYALLGLAAVVAATTHAPLLATVLAFEMSGDYALVLPLLAVTALAAGTARLLRVDSLYAAEIRRKGIVWEGSIGSRIARAVRARDVLEPALIVDGSRSGLAVKRELDRHEARVAYAVGEPIRAFDLRSAPLAGETSLAEAGGIIEPLGLDDDLPTMTERLWSMPWGELPVRDGDGRIAGIVTRRGLLGALDRELLSRDLLLTRMVFEGGDRAAMVELPPGSAVAVVPAPPDRIGAAMDVLAVRREHGVWILGVRAAGSRGVWVDPLDIERVDAGASWLVLGAREAIERIGGDVR